jgi:SAM-dependent methyltransferase
MNSDYWVLHTLHERKYYQLRYAEIRTQLLKYLTKGLILDVGGAHGLFAEYLGLPRERTFIVDLSRVALMEARNRGYNVIRCDIHHLPFRASTFALVYCFEVLEHLTYPQACLREVHRVMTQGGIIYAGTPTIKPDFIEHFQCWNAKQFRELFEKAGFSFIGYIKFPILSIWQLWSSSKQYLNREYLLHWVLYANPIYRLWKRLKNCVGFIIILIAKKHKDV